MDRFEIRIRTHPVPGIAEAETAAVLEAEAAYEDALEANRDFLADDWEARAHSREAVLTAREIEGSGKRNARRPAEIHSASIKRAEILAELAKLRGEVVRLDRIAREAIAAALPGEVGPAAVRARESLRAFEASIAAMERAATEARRAVSHAVTVKHRANGGSAWADPGHMAGDYAFGGGEASAANAAREVLLRARQYAARMIGGPENG